MREQVRELIATLPLHRPGLLEMAALLPADDGELHEWLETAVRKRDGMQFIILLCAAAISGRKLQASLLAEGTAMMPDEHRFAWIAWQMEGDVTEHLLQAIKGPVMHRGLNAMALFIAAAWWQKHREGPVPGEIIGQARRLLREKELHKDPKGTLTAMAVLTNDPGLRAVSMLGKFPHLEEAAAKVKDALFAFLEKPFSDLIPETAEREYHQGGTMRRAVERIGRNEPCPCGSGKKYKHCCVAKDHERLKLSSAVAGKTKVELDADPTEGLTLARLQEMSAPTLSRLDPARVPELLRMEYMFRLMALGYYRELASAVRTYPMTDHLEANWKRMFFFPVRNWNREGAAEILAAHPRGEELLPEMEEPGLRILLASADPTTLLQAIEQEARATLKTNDEDLRARFAMALLGSPYAGLGIFVARSFLPLVDSASYVFDEILRARDSLGLPPDDEFSDFMDERAARQPKGSGNETLREAQAKLERKAAEVRQVQERLATLQREITLREKRESRPAQERVATPGEGEGEPVREMRAKMDRLKALLHERGEERVTLRREVEKLHEEVETLRSAGANAAAGAASEEAEEAGEQVQVSGQQPVRMIEVPRKFRERLAEFPLPVGRAVMQHLGRIASGEPTAFMGLTKLHDCGNVLRLRVAGDYRLLLRLQPENVQVIDVVNRRDLQARIKILRASVG